MPCRRTPPIPRARLVNYIAPSASVGYFDDDFAAPVRRAFEHFVSPTGLIEPQHFAHFTLERPARRSSRQLFSIAQSLPERGRKRPAHRAAPLFP